MRRGDVIKEGGFDGEYGVVKVFSEEERKAFVDWKVSPVPAGRPARAQEAGPQAQGGRPGRNPPRSRPPCSPPCGPRAGNPARSQGVPVFGSPVEGHQRRSACCARTCGSGSGKTRTLVGRVQRLIRDGVPAQRILAVTFTHRAAAELKERLEPALGAGVPCRRPTRCTRWPCPSGGRGFRRRAGRGAD